MVNNKRKCKCRNISYLDIENESKLGDREIEDIIKTTVATKYFIYKRNIKIVIY